jgi:hypothetical protein
MTGLGTADAAIGGWAKKVNGSLSRRGSGTKKITKKMREGWSHLHWRTPGGRWSLMLLPGIRRRKKRVRKSSSKFCSDRCGLELTAAMNKEMNLLS